MRKGKIAMLLAAAAAAAAAGFGLASDGEGREEGRGHEEGRRGAGRGPRRGSAPGDAAERALYRKECGACHLDFPPSLLPAESHRRLMAGLERHFGQNAELEPEVRARLEGWLVANAARAPRESRPEAAPTRGEPPLRITEAPWFRREHRGLARRVAADPSLRSMANCAACHPGARDWDFDDDRAKIPRAKIPAG